MSLPFFSTPRQTCLRHCENNCWTITLKRFRTLLRLIPQLSCHHYYAYVYVRIHAGIGRLWLPCGFYERKAHFLQSVPYALKNLRWLLEHATLPIALPALTAAFKEHCNFRKIAPSQRSRKQAVSFQQKKTACAQAPLTEKLIGTDFQLFISSRLAKR